MGVTCFRIWKFQWFYSNWNRSIPVFAVGFTRLFKDSVEMIWGTVNSL